jgi:hypothetical protein
VGWRDDPKKLIDALVESRWIDRDQFHRLVIHDWPEHVQDWIKRKVQRIQKKKNYDEIQWLVLTPFVVDASTPVNARQRPSTPVMTSQSPLTDNLLGNNDLTRHDAINPHAGGLGEVKLGQAKSSSGTQVLKPGKDSAPAKNGNSSHAIWKRDTTLLPFVEAYTLTGKALTDYDWAEAWQEWRVLSIEQKLAAVAGVHARIAAGLCVEPEFVMLPKNFIKKREWERAITKRKTASRDELEAYWQS